MILFDKEDFNNWIGYMYSYKYMIVGYAWKPVIFFVEVPIDTENNNEDDE